MMVNTSKISKKDRERQGGILPSNDKIEPMRHINETTKAMLVLSSPFMILDTAFLLGDDTGYGN